MNSNFRRKKSFILFVCLKKAFTFARELKNDKETKWDLQLTYW